MKTIIIRNSTRELMQARVPDKTLSTEDSRQLANGDWETDVDDDVHAFLMEIDPDPDTAIRQALAGGHA